ncbi:F0F1 ATP synthase subunit B [Candidatus Thiothrix sp. Deng01]|uniref:ATP synthase subunit b n=1 Tax=Candidatus Thiothrix phosphatis TaxID=3112415 RepID=A0ABU6CW56_9GAMM|nr:F0F1 ATP synthase subunit B [Candidatus Thiothrix sp. Deng01]MEB4591060.1 F0F1 ATP synthase subunit B [Candidatus Thiothrix sp. Deng01]
MNVTATLIGQMLVFTVLIWFVKGVLWEPMLKMLEDRKARIADGLAAAEKGKHEEELARQKALDELKKAKAAAAEIIAQAQKRAGEIVDEAKNSAVEEQNRVKAAAQADIEQEVSRARETLRKQVASLAVSGAEKILGKEIDAAAHAKALDDLAAQI